MTLTRENIEDTSSSDEMLQVDLGRDISYIYDALDEIDLDSEDPGVLDPSFYREKLSQVRRALMIVQQLYSKAMRAKTSAQTRLTSRQTRYEVLLNSSLENNEDVKMGQSAPERMARATNRLVDLSNAIRESKNEVEAIANAVKVIGTYNKSLTTISADIKQQARLVETELSIFKGKGNTLPPSPEAFHKRVKKVEDKYSATPVASVVTDDDDIDMDAMSKAFAFSQGLSLPAPTEEPDDASSEDDTLGLTLSLSSDENTSGNSGKVITDKNDSGLDASGATGLDFAFPLEDDPDAPSPLILEKTSSSAESDATEPDEGLPLEGLTDDVGSDDTNSSEDDTDLDNENESETGLTFIEDNQEGADESIDIDSLLFGDTENTGATLEESTSSDGDKTSLGDTITEPPAEGTDEPQIDISLEDDTLSDINYLDEDGFLNDEDYEVVSSKETPSKVSGVFEENTGDSVSLSSLKQEEVPTSPESKGVVDSTPVPDEGDAPEEDPEIDDLLKELGIE